MAGSSNHQSAAFVCLLVTIYSSMHTVFVSALHMAQSLGFSFGNSCFRTSTA